MKVSFSKFYYRFTSFVRTHRLSSTVDRCILTLFFLLYKSLYDVIQRKAQDAYVVIDITSRIFVERLT